MCKYTVAQSRLEICSAASAYNLSTTTGASEHGLQKKQSTLMVCVHKTNLSSPPAALNDAMMLFRVDANGAERQNALKALPAM